MCGCEKQPSYSASLEPPRGPPLGLKEGVTWIGRGDFEASLRAQLLCSRRQACLKLTEAGLHLECYGCNPLLFVVCHSKSFYGTEATPASELFQLRKGEAVQLSDGDQFYFAAMECLLMVVIRQNDIVPTSRDAPQLPLQKASEARVKDKEQNFIEDYLADVLQAVEIRRELQGPAEDCGPNDPQTSPLKDDSAVCANYSNSVAAFHCPDLTGPQELLAASNPSGVPTIDCQVSENSRDESVNNVLEDSDYLGLDAYDCAALEGAFRFDVQQPLRGMSLLRNEEIFEPAVANETDNCLDESNKICEKNCTEEALSNYSVGEVLEDTKCPQLSIDIEPCRLPYDIQENCRVIGTSSCSGGIAHRLAAIEDLRSEACAPGEPFEPRETQYYTPILSSGTIDDRSIEDEVLLSEPARELAVSSVEDCSSKRPVCSGQADCGISFKFPVSEGRDEISDRMEVEEIPELTCRANEREDGLEVSGDVEGESWPDEPVEGMEPVIASVSGYEGVDRQNLVKLINKTGAAFTGGLSKANTHLVCWNFHGKKFDRAMKMHKVVINHQWFEDCLQAGKRLSEDSYKLRSGEDVGPLKWTETSAPPVTERPEPSSGAINQHLDNNEDFFLNADNREANMGQQEQHVLCATTSYREDSLATSRQAGLATVKARHIGGRKLRRLIRRSGMEARIDPLTVELQSLVGENPTAPASTSGRAGESYQRRNGEIVGDLEQGCSPRRRKSASSALHNAGQVQVHDTKRRKSASSVLDRSVDVQEEGAVGNLRENLRGRGRAQYSTGPPARPDREFTVINLDDVNDDVREIGLRKHHAASAQATEDTNANINSSRNSQNSQSTQRDKDVACNNLPTAQVSQRDKEVACAICLVEAKSLSEGLLECGHKFCYKCIFTWTVQAVKGPSCPLCKASCDFITRQEVNSSGKLDETVVVVGKKENGYSTRSQRTVVLNAVCIHCANSDSESLLMRCGTCGNRAVHTFCMDPPAPPPWFCPGCTHGHQRDSMRLAWNQFLPGPSAAAYADPTQEIRPVSRPLNVRRRNIQPYTLRRSSRPVPTYRPTLHTELTQSMGPVRRRNVVGQHSLRSWLNNDNSNEDS